MIVPLNKAARGFLPAPPRVMANQFDLTRTHSTESDDSRETKVCCEKVMEFDVKLEFQFLPSSLLVLFEL